MSGNEKYMRSAEITSNIKGDNILDRLSEIGDGYVLKPVAKSHGVDRTHVLVTPKGNEIHLINKSETQVATSNIIGQDEEGYVPLKEDELAILARVLAPKQDQLGLSIQVAASNHDLDI